LRSIKFGADIDDRDWKRVKNTVQNLEKNGFDSVWVMDHFWWKNYDNCCLECWSTLSAIASITKHIRLGSLVTCNIYRQPSLLAKMAASLDVISNGRLDFGIGAGWFKEECISYGIRFPPPNVRIEGVKDAIRIAKKMWTQSSATYDGRYYHIQNAICLPKPIQKPHPPIWVGGQGKLMLKLAAEEANGINFYGSPNDFKERYKVLRKFCTNYGREYDQIKKSWTGEVVLASGKDELYRKISKLLRIRGYEGKVEQYIERNLVGTPDEICSKVEEYASLGVEYFWPDIEPSEEIMTDENRKIFIDEVVKKFK
jgi:F420-dependent oxidoreductase-like protein